MNEQLHTLYARFEPSTEGSAPTWAKDVTLWREYRESDFPHATPKLFAEGPRLADGTILYPVARIPYYSSNKPRKRDKTTMLNCFQWNLQWITP